MEKIEDSKRLAFEELEEVYYSYLERLDKKAKSITGEDIDKSDIILLESELYTLNQEEFDLWSVYLRDMQVKEGKLMEKFQ